MFQTFPQDPAVSKARVAPKGKADIRSIICVPTQALTEGFQLVW